MRPLKLKRLYYYCFLETCMCLNTRRIDKTGAKSLDLSYEVNEFKAKLYDWDKWESELQHCCGISVQHVRNCNLPDDVFEPGEVKPAKPKKKAAQAPNGVKRKAPTQVCNCSTRHPLVTNSCPGSHRYSQATADLDGQRWLTLDPPTSFFALIYLMQGRLSPEKINERK